MWAGDMGDKYPWNVEGSKGGSMGSLDWTDNFRVCSNELRMSQVLVCPTDLTKKAATNWSTMRGDLNISYFVAKSALEGRSTMILLGDRNVTGGGGGLDPSWNVYLGSSIDAGWDDKLHGRAGIVAMADGSARKIKVPNLREQISFELTSGSTTNVIFAKPRGIL